MTGCDRWVPVDSVEVATGCLSFGRLDDLVQPGPPAETTRCATDGVTSPNWPRSSWAGRH